jgi:hypothetical protein
VLSFRDRRPSPPLCFMASSSTSSVDDGNFPVYILDSGDRSPSPPPRFMTSSSTPFADDENSIRDRCSSISWASIAEHRPYHDGRNISKITESHDQLKQSDCRMCRLLATIKPPDLDGSGCTLRAFPAWEALQPRNEPCQYEAERGRR